MSISSKEGLEAKKPSRGRFVLGCMLGSIAGFVVGEVYGFAMGNAMEPNEAIEIVTVRHSFIVQEPKIISSSANSINVIGPRNEDAMMVDAKEVDPMIFGGITFAIMGGVVGAGLASARRINGEYVIPPFDEWDKLME